MADTKHHNWISFGALDGKGRETTRVHVPLLDITNLEIEKGGKKALIFTGGNKTFVVEKDENNERSVRIWVRKTTNTMFNVSKDEYERVEKALLGNVN